MGVRVEWDDNTIGGMLKSMEHKKFAQRIKTYKEAYRGPSEAAGYFDS